LVAAAGSGSEVAVETGLVAQAVAGLEAAGSAAVGWEARAAAGLEAAAWGFLPGIYSSDWPR